MISCDKHDYVEIACLYKFPVSIELKTGEKYAGTATNVTFNQIKEECLLLTETEQGDQLFELTSIKSMTAQRENPHFSTVILNK